MDISHIGEFSLIRRLTRGVKTSKDVIQGIGDDAAVLAYDEERYQLITTDALVEGVHFRFDWFTPEQVGRKAVEVNVSDIAAMGGTPKSATVAFTLPENLPVKTIKGIMRGIKKRCRHHRIDLVGGNISKGNELTITLSLTGLVKKGALRLRRGAQPGQLVCVTGKLGKGAAGLELCEQGKKKSAGPFLEPKARKREAKAITPYATSMIDISDGLGGELHHLAEASKAGFLIDKDKLPLHPLTKRVEGDPCRKALYSGDELELLFTIKPEDVPHVKKFATAIGDVTKKGVLLKDKEHIFKIGRGFDHFT